MQRCAASVDAHDVGCAEQLVERDEASTGRVHLLRRERGIGDEDLAHEAGEAACHGDADRAVADQAEHDARELPALVDDVGHRCCGIGGTPDDVARRRDQ